MWAIESGPAGVRTRPKRRERGVTSIEFSLLAPAFFLLIFGILEIARAIYLINTLQEVTRRAASFAAASRFDNGTLDTVRQKAILADADGNLLLGAPITPAHLKIEYLSIARDSGTGNLSSQPTNPMPADPTANRVVCLGNPYDPSCIRLVRVRVCDPNGTADCTPVRYQMLFPLIDLSGVNLPRSETVVPVQALGYVAGSGF